MFQLLSRLMALLFAVVSLSVPATAQDPTALQVTGSDGTTLDLSLADLDALEQVTITSTTIWTEGTVTFTGPSLRSVLDVAGISSKDLTLTALNDYAIEMPAPNAGETFPILATRQDGDVMSVRDKGPFWIVFPYDSDPAFQTETIFSQSIWQLDRIEVLD